MRNLAQPREQYVSFAGGVDLVTPAIESAPGSLSDAQNIEIDVNNGYQTILGYERYDGQAAPSDAVYYVISCTFSGVISVGDTVTGDTSAATGYVIVVGATFIAVTKKTGSFQSGENLSVSAVVQAVSTSADVVDGASTIQLRAYYKFLAAAQYRADIAAVPGSGDILGIWMLGSTRYAFRNTADGTAAKMFKSSAAGWVEVALGLEMSFTSGGTYEIAEGDVITGATSAATATITRVCLQSGSWAGGDAAGRLIFASQTGTFVAENLNVGANLNVATIAANSSAITLLPSGRYEFDNYNFSGLANNVRAYGCDGVNRGFEFDGTVFAPIATGMAADTPSHVLVHKNQLFFAFGGSAQHSGIGTPFTWTILSGAAELAIGDAITGYVSESGTETGAALAIFSRNSIHILYGNDPTDWNLVRYRDEIGAYAHSIQQISNTVMLDDRGVVNLSSTQEYGNFNHSTLSQLIQPWITAQKTGVSASCVVRDKNQYRVFFDNGYAAYFTFYNRKLLGITICAFEDPVTCCFSREDSDGREVIMFGSDNGFVYQMERDTSFDGVGMPWFFKLRNLSFSSPRTEKRFLNAVTEVTGTTYSEFSFRYELGYATPDINQPLNVTETLDLSVSQWDSFTWDAFAWDGISLLPANMDVEGTAENLSLVFSGTSEYFGQIKFSGVVVAYIPRRRMR